MFVFGERLRVEVEAPPTGGGDHYEPQTAEEARDLLLPRVQALVAQMAQLPEEYRGDRLYVETQLLPNYLAPSHYPTALLSEVDAVTVGSRAAADIYRTQRRQQETVTRRLILAIDDAGLQRLQRLVDHPGAGRSQQNAFAEIRKLDDLGMRSPSDVVVRLPEDIAAEITWEAVLHPLTTSEGHAVPLSDAAVEKWFHLVEGRGGRAHREYVRRVGGLTFAPVTLRGGEALDVARFNPLRALRPMPSIRPIPAIFLRAAAMVAPPVVLDPIASSPTVAVFDGGVDNRSTASALFPNSDVDLTTEVEQARLLSHGTGVVGATLYGLVVPGTRASRPPLPVISYRVLPALAPPGLEEYWLLDQIRDVVSRGDHQIINLSLGPEKAVEDTAEPDRWTSELDELASELDVLFIIAAGNGGNEDRATGLHRVQVPGDMVNGLAVGACSVPPPEAPWARTDYSSMGPGRHGNRVQPSGVQFGGDASRPFPILTSNGDVLDTFGTSFAAPLVTNALSRLTTRLPQPNPSVLRSFAVHFAERLSRNHAFEDVGYGRFPLNFDPLLECDADEVHVLFCDEIDHADLLGYRIPVPSGLTVPLDLRITLAYASPIEATQPTEYTRVSLDLSLRPHEYQHTFNPPKGVSGLRRQVLDFRSPEAGDLMRAGWAMSQEPVTKSLGAGPRSPEIDLRDGGKWETVRHHRVRLRADEVGNPRIEVGYVARRNGRLVHESEPVRFALLLSIKDRSESGALYDAVEAHFPVLRPLAPVGSRVRVSGRVR